MVVEAADEPNDFHHLYDLDQPIKAKIETIATEIYGAAAVTYEPQAEKQIARLRGERLRQAADLHGQDAPEPEPRPDAQGRADRLHAARFAKCGRAWARASSTRSAGDMRTMPGLSEHPAAENVDIDEDGNIVGLF